MAIVCHSRMAGDSKQSDAQHVLLCMQSALIGLRLMKSHKRPFTILKGVNGAIKPVRPGSPCRLTSSCGSAVPVHALTVPDAAPCCACAKCPLWASPVM